MALLAAPAVRCALAPSAAPRPARRAAPGFLGAGSRALSVSRAPLRAPRARQVTVSGLFGLGLPELVLIGGVVAVLFGPSKLPELGKSLGKTVKSFQSAAKARHPSIRVAAPRTRAQAPGCVSAQTLTAAALPPRAGVRDGAEERQHRGAPHSRGGQAGRPTPQRLSRGERGCCATGERLARSYRRALVTLSL